MTSRRSRPLCIIQNLKCPLEKHQWFIVKILFTYLLFFAVCLIALIDPDFGWHLQSGNYIRVHGIPSHDVFTYTARNFPWIDHEWGNDVIVSMLYQLHGYLALALVYAGLWTATLLINGIRARIAVLLIAYLAVIGFVGVRPEVWSFAGLALLLFIINHSKSWKSLLWLPLLFLFWVNLHGGFIAGLAVLLYLAVFRRSKPLLVVFIVSVLATFVNPYGLRLYEEVFRTLTDRSLHVQITEWYSFALPPASWAYIIVWGAGFWLFAKQRIKNWLGLGPILLLASLSSLIYFPLFVVATLQETNGYFEQVLRELPEKYAWHAKSIGLLIVASFIGCLVLLNLTATQTVSSYPVTAVAYLKTHRCQGNLFNDYNYGGYLIWQLPNQPVYIDGRMPSWRTQQGVKYIDMYLAIVHDPVYMKAQFRKYDIKCALVENIPVFQGVIQNLRASGWNEPVANKGYVLLEAPN